MIQFFRTWLFLGFVLLFELALCTVGFDTGAAIFDRNATHTPQKIISDGKIKAHPTFNCEESIQVTHTYLILKSKYCASDFSIFCHNVLELVLSIAIRRE